MGFGDVIFACLSSASKQSGSWRSKDYMITCFEWFLNRKLLKMMSFFQPRKSISGSRGTAGKGLSNSCRHFTGV